MIYTDVGAGGVLGPRKFKFNVAAMRDETLSIRSVSRTAGRAKRSWVPPPEESLGHLFPEAVAQWHPEQDCHPGLTAFTVRPGSGKSIRWRCEEHGHEWHVSPGDRTKKGRLSQCPKCHRMALGLSAEKTYLADTNPELRAEWHPLQDFHPDATIENTTTGSARAIRWRCVRGHEWHAAAKQRARGQGCDRCVDFPGPGESVAEHFPHLVDEWHPEQIRHRDATAENTKRGSRKRILWRCSDGHVWTARLNSRTGAAPSNCPTCERLRRGSSAERQYVCDFPDAQLVGEWHAVQAQAQGATPQNTTVAPNAPFDGAALNAATTGIRRRSIAAALSAAVARAATTSLAALPSPAGLWRSATPWLPAIGTRSAMAVPLPRLTRIPAKWRGGAAINAGTGGRRSLSQDGPGTRLLQVLLAGQAGRLAGGPPP